MADDQAYGALKVIAGEDLTAAAKLYCFVMGYRNSTTGRLTVKLCTVGSHPIGVLVLNGNTGEAVAIAKTRTSKIKYGGVVNAGNRLIVAALGTATTATYTVACDSPGIAMSDGVSGDIGEILFDRVEQEFYTT